MTTDTNLNASEGNEINQKGPKSVRLLDSLKKYLFVMGSCLLLFAAARNSFHWHIHRIWGATGSFWQSCWDVFYDKWGRDNELMFSCGSIWIITMSVFWLCNGFFIVLDVTGIPQSVRKYKVQEEVELDMAKFRKCMKLVLFNQFVVSLPFCLSMAYMYLWRGNSIGGELPSFPWVMLEIMVFSFVEEFFFYYTHSIDATKEPESYHPSLGRLVNHSDNKKQRNSKMQIVVVDKIPHLALFASKLLHHPRIYKYIHKTHHEWTAPIGIVSIYAHPLEHLISNILPPALGPLLMGSHLATVLLWFSIALMSTTVSHCGYHLPLFPSPEAHDYHHLKFNQNFGVLGVLDRLHGTDIQFRNTKQYQRHFMLLSLVPMSQQFPSSPKKKPE